MPGACSLHGPLFLAQQWQRADFVQFGGLQTLLVQGISPHGQALATTPAVTVTARPGNTGCAPPSHCPSCLEARPQTPKPQQFSLSL